MIGRIMDKPDKRLSGYIRLFGSTLKPAVYCAATLRGAPPLQVWQRPLAEVLPFIEPDWSTSLGMSRFFTGVWRWTEVRNDPEQLREMFLCGYGALVELCDSAERLTERK